jgi:hypothetical protein
VLTLQNPALTVDLLDPADPADRARLGTRYCWGAYIWQVRDAAAGDLVAGGEYPRPTPRPFNGQGLPESFRHAELGTNHPLILEDNRGFIIGVGDVAPDVAGEIVLTRPCDWTITRNPESMEFCTAQSGQGYACQLTRRLTLTGRTLTSATMLANPGSRPLPLHWFAHPFFALTDRLITCDLPASWGMAENTGFALNAAHRLSLKRRFRNIDDGHFELLRVGAGTPLHAVVSHPKVSAITFSTDFTPDLCPVWGNCNTWSIEPYLTTELAPGTRRAWQLKYEFGTVA